MGFVLPGSAAGRVCCLIPLLLAAAPALATLAGAESAAGPPAPLGDLEVAGTPAEGLVWGFTADEFDWQRSDVGEALNWEVRAWAGTDRSRLWLRDAGERTAEGATQSRRELFWGQPRGGWELLLGARYDSGELPSRGYAAIGAQSLPEAELQWQVTGYLGHGSSGGADAHGGVRLLARYGWPLVDRLSLRARAELEYWNEDHVRLTVGSGPCETRAGLQLAYETGPGLAWYAGGDWLYQIQDTARLTAQQGGRYRGFALVTGVRFSF